MSDTTDTNVSILESVDKLTKDLKQASVTLGKQEARFLVAQYYKQQEDRIRSAAQIREMTEKEPGKPEEPHAVIAHFNKQFDILEGQIKRALDAYSMSSPVGQWARSIVGIGPVLAAGLMAHIEIEKAPTVGHIWAFAGLDPTKDWKKGEKRPWNADLKVLCWKIGESFVKVSGREDAYYGQVYTQRKEYEQKKNDATEYFLQAKAKLEKFKIGKETEAYKAYSQGKLPPAHIHRRACRYAVKLFLAHLHHVWYLDHYKVPPPKPYAIAIQGHGHYLPPPGI